MSRNTRYSPELRERAVRMAIEKRADYPSEWATFSRGLEAVRDVPGNPQDLGPPRPSRPRHSGRSHHRRACSLKALERENRDLRRANEILKDASIFFATELDGRTKR